MTFRMPAEWERDERTLMCWPCRASPWGHRLAQGRQAFATVADAVAAFERVAMVAQNAARATQARGMLAGNVDVVVRPIDGAWLGDTGPLCVTAGPRQSRAVLCMTIQVPPGP